MVTLAFRLLPVRRHSFSERTLSAVPKHVGTALGEGSVNTHPVAMTTALATRPSALTSLLAGYITGAVDDDAMARFDDLFEDAAATAQERLAFANFYLDAVVSDDTAEALPSPTEVPGILAAARA